MDKNEKEVAKKAEKIKRWLKDPYNLGFVALILIAFGIRLYYFFLTQNQAVWWDEGEYMLRVKHLVLDTPQSGFFKGRELFTPYFWALIYYLFNSEIAIRFVQVCISTLTVWATYFLGKRVYDRKIGLLAGAFMTFFWLHLFFTERLLTYLYAPLFYTLALGLFWVGYNSNSEFKDKYLMWFFITIMIGIGIYYSIAFSAISVVLYLFLTEGFSFIKDKRLWKYLLISLPLLLLSFIPSYIVQGSIIPRLSQVGKIQETEIGAGLAGLFTYTDMMPRLMLSVYLGILILSLYLIIKLILFFDIIIKDKEINDYKRNLFIFIGAFIPFAAYTWLSITAGGPAGAVYDAWILPIFPALFCLMSKMVFNVKDYVVSKINDETMKKVAILIIFAVILFGFYSHIKFADESIKAKEPSFYNLKPAGEWLKENTEKGDKIYSAAIPELTYYSEREILGHDDPMVNNSLEGFIKYINKEKPKYFVLTVWERSPEWAYSLPELKYLNLTPATAFFINNNGQQQADVVIYKVSY